ncbi:MAG: glycosyltransferase [Vulcanococcus sp.]
MAVILLFTARYVHWRLSSFPFQNFYETPSGWWMAFVLAIEMLAIVEYLQFLSTISWLTDRRPQADQVEARLRAQYQRDGVGAIPSIDVLIPTYNEAEDVVGKTILAAAQLDYPNFRVYVLDDGQRPWLKEFCVRAGVQYITRKDRSGAKAGNINNALNLIQGDLNLLLDADFIPYKNCLWRLAGFFEDDSIATVQTPQNFYNPDAIQHNINISTSWGCEQEFFFQIIMPGRDAVGAAFCCGSCCMHRTSALRAVGGFPTSSITEDILLTVALVKQGWRTVYLREANTMGLAAETLSSFFIQRQRWGRGNIQVGYIIAKEKGLSLRNKILFFPFYWMIQHTSRVVFQFIPVVFFLTGAGPLPPAEGAEIISYQMPFILAVMSSMFVLMRPFYLPLFTEAMSLFSAFALLPELLQSLFKPYGKGFSVTPKGHLDSDGSLKLFQPTLWPACALLAINIVVFLRILLGLGEASGSVGWELSLYAVIWCTFNVTMLVICILVSVERPQPRQEHRLLVNQPVTLEQADGTSCAGTLVDLSMSGARIQQPSRHAASEPCRLILSNGLQIPLAKSWLNQTGDLISSFAPLSWEERRSLIAFAFSGAFPSAEQPQRVQLRRTFQQLWRDLVG